MGGAAGVRGGTSQCLSLTARGSGSSTGAGEGLWEGLRRRACNDALACCRSCGVYSAGTSPGPGSSSNIVGSGVHGRRCLRLDERGAGSGDRRPATELGQAVVWGEGLKVEPMLPGGLRLGEQGLRRVKVPLLELGLW